MKRFFAVMMAVMLILSVGTLFASADDLSADVYVTISNKGELAVPAEKVTVTDIDGDGALTVNDTLYAAHESFYEGGAEAGYATQNTQWGLSLAKLWGVANGGSYGYYVNNASAWSMTDPVKDGDYVAAYSFVDPVGLSDKYTYFDKTVEEIEPGEIALTLSKADFDADWNPITVAVEGAVISIDGVNTDIKTDENGKAVVNLDTDGKHIISAYVEGQNIVPPVYVASVKGEDSSEDTEAPSKSTADESEATYDEPGPATYDTDEPVDIEPVQTPSTDPVKTDAEAETEEPTQGGASKATNDSAKVSGSGVSAGTGAVQTGASSPAIYIVIALAAVSLVTVFVIKKRNEE